MSRSLSILLISILITANAFAQVEQLFVQTDKGYHVSGEIIWFKVAILNADTSEIGSGVIHAQLVKPDGNILDDQKLKLVGRVASGSFSLPVTSDEGYYLLRVFTKYNLNYGEGGVWSKEVPVYNALETDLSAIITLPHEEGSTFSHGNANFAEISATRYSPGDSVSLVISTSDLSSVSVLVLDSISNTSWSARNVLSSSSGVFTNQFTHERSLTIDGILSDPETGEPVTSPVISVYNGESASFLRASSDSGRIMLGLPDYDGFSTFQVFNLNPYQKPVNKFQPNDMSMKLKPYSNKAKPPVSQTVADYILKSKKRRKILELFGMDLYRSRVEKRFEPNVTVPDNEYDMRKYQNIRTLEEFIDEGIFTAKVTGRKGQTRIRLYNVEDRFTFPDAPWYIVDGILTSDEQKVLEIPFRDIKKVNLYTKTSTIKQYFEHFLWRNGVIEVITSDVRYRRQFSAEPNTLLLEGFRNSPQHMATLPRRQEGLPDLRSVIAWLPEVATVGTDRANVTFVHSDDSGTFKVIVTGISTKGEVLEQVLNYVVGRE